jgi:hypothetical protein
VRLSVFIADEGKIWPADGNLGTFIPPGPAVVHRLRTGLSTDFRAALALLDLGSRW